MIFSIIFTDSNPSEPRHSSWKAQNMLQYSFVVSGLYSSLISDTMEIIESSTSGFWDGTIPTKSPLSFTCRLSLFSVFIQFSTFVMLGGCSRQWKQHATLDFREQRTSDVGGSKLCQVRYTAVVELCDCTRSYRRQQQFGFNLFRASCLLKNIVYVMDQCVCSL